MFAGEKGQFLSPRVGQDIIEVLVGSIVGKTERIHQGWPEYVGDLNRGILPARNILLIGNGTAVKVWDPVRIVIKAVSAEDPHFFADLMIDPAHRIIFVGHLKGRRNEKCRTVSEVRGIRSLEEIQIGPDSRANRHRAGGVARPTVVEVGVRALEGLVRNDS